MKIGSLEMEQGSAEEEKSKLEEEQKKEEDRNEDEKQNIKTKTIPKENNAVGTKKDDSKPNLKVGDPDEIILKNLLTKCGGEVSGSSSQSDLNNYINKWEAIDEKYNPNEKNYKYYEQQYNRAKTLITSK